MEYWCPRLARTGEDWKGRQRMIRKDIQRGLRWLGEMRWGRVSTDGKSFVSATAATT